MLQAIGIAHVVVALICAITVTGANGQTIWPVAPAGAGPSGALIRTQLFDDNETAVDDGYLIGVWASESPDGCRQGDTISFFSFGVLAAGNGGGNPVEVVGAWVLEGNTLSVIYADLRDTDEAEASTGIISDAGESRFVLTADFMRGGQSTLFRCD